MCSAFLFGCIQLTVLCCSTLFAADGAVPLSAVTPEFSASLDDLRRTIAEHLDSPHTFAGRRIAGGQHINDIVGGLCTAINETGNICPPRFGAHLSVLGHAIVATSYCFKQLTACLSVVGSCIATPDYNSSENICMPDAVRPDYDRCVDKPFSPSIPCTRRQFLVCHVPMFKPVSTHTRCILSAVCSMQSTWRGLRKRSNAPSCSLTICSDQRLVRSSTFPLPAIPCSARRCYHTFGESFAPLLT